MTMSFLGRRIVVPPGFYYNDYYENELRAGGRAKRSVRLSVPP